MTVIQNRRPVYLLRLVFVAGVTVYAGVTAGIVQATAFVPAFLLIYLLERKRTR